MTGVATHIAGMGVVSALGLGVAETTRALCRSERGLGPLTLFAAPPNARLPVGEVTALNRDDRLPRTHRMALQAADQALVNASGPPDAIVLGITTGGMPLTENLLEQGVSDPAAYSRHGVGTVAEALACHLGCRGPLITISTACSSGAAAIKVALEMLRCGMAARVLAGGADGLCRLTYFGFKSLQLIDPAGARPLDRDRRGMTIAEGAGMLLLTAEDTEEAGLQILGGGLSCDAYHPAAPHPQGAGALAAMQAALEDAGITPADIDYINLHGTGTPDNDRSEALAVKALFKEALPFLSSTKGSHGHTLAAAGAIEAIISGLSIREGFIPPNTGCRNFDAALELTPVVERRSAPLAVALSNSFGFGGNNAALVIGRPRRRPAETRGGSELPLVVSGYACLSGAGRTAESLEALLSDRPCRGRLADALVSAGLPPRTIRRLKRLPKLTLALAQEACREKADAGPPTAVYMGTGWGALSETHDFIQGLFQSGGQFPSPTDFIGSVHNAPAGQVAMWLQARGANITTSGGDYSFEQALLTADLLSRGVSGAMLVMGADEAHEVLSPLFDPGAELSDGGGALLLRRGRPKPGAVTIEMLFYRSGETSGCLDELIARLGGPRRVNLDFGALLVGIPALHRPQAEAQMARFIQLCDFKGAVIDYRRRTGEFASAAAVAAVVGVRLAELGGVPAPLAGGSGLDLAGRGLLVLGLGPYVTAVRIVRS